MRRTRILRNAPLMVCASGLLSLAALITTPLSAQEVRGIVLGADGTSIASGVVAVMTHATQVDSILARAVTNDRGRFSLKIPAATPAHLRLLRIGYEALDAGTFTLTAGEVKDTTITLNENRIRLATIDVKSSSRCQLKPDGAQLVGQLFQQVRTALIATTVPVAGRVTAQFTSFDRKQDRRGRLLVPVERTTYARATLKPYESLRVDSLERVGYVRALGDDAVTSGADYYAPDAEVLLSDKFLTQHCLSLVASKDKDSGLIGIGFRPAQRRNLVDIEGTIWLDRATSELQFLEYSYTSLPDLLRPVGLGGRVDYAHFANGGWFVSSWLIRMPLVTTQVMNGLRGLTQEKPVVNGQQVSGGAVQTIRVEDQVLFLNPGAAVVGTFAGDESPTRTTTLAQALSSAAGGGPKCEATSDVPGLISGHVYDERRKAFEGASVRAEWKDNFRISLQSYGYSTQSVQSISGGDGSYGLCGVALNRPVEVSARRTTRWTRPTVIELSIESPSAELDISLGAPLAEEGGDPNAARARESIVAPVAVASRTSLIVTNSSGMAVPYALVAINNKAPRVADANGRVELGSGDNDTINVVVRRVGFQPFDGRLVRTTNAEPFTLSLFPAGTTSSIGSAAGIAILERTGFYARMLQLQEGTGGGEFATPEQLASRPYGKVSDLFTNSRLTRVESNGGKIMLRGRNNCEAFLVIDGERRSLSGTSLDDIVQQGSVMAIEVYGAINIAPQAIRQFAGGDAATSRSQCAAVVIWTGVR